MAVRFIHTADWQIGKPFTQFPKDWQVRLTDARLDAIDRMAQLARDNRAAFVLVAGDLFDSDGLGGVTLQAPFARMAEAAPVHWHVLPGNHDPARPGGIWDRAARAGLPGNVTVHTTPVPVEIGHDVTLLPAPLIARRVANDPTVWMDDATSTPGNIRLGLAHGAIGRYGSDDHASVPLDPARAEKASL
ncbi:MAG: metallophosphoesterase, partial [Pseudomonadota bacterium]